MKNNKVLYIILLISFSLAIFLGMIDYETESLVHLFTAEPGNIVALLMYTGIFSLIGLGVYYFFKFLWKILVN